MFKRKNPEPVAAPKKHPLAVQHFFMPPKAPEPIAIAPAVPVGVAQNHAMQYLTLGTDQGMNHAVASWFMSQRFIGYQAAAWIAKHWLVDKAISAPARDAIRNGFQIQGEAAIVEQLEKQDKKLNLSHAMREFIRVGRRQGGALALFHTCPQGSDPKDYYAAPLNLEAVTEYHGITVVSPSNASPLPVADDVTNPASLNYLKPSMYAIAGIHYHESHFLRYVPYPVDDILKPTYRYFGASVPERIYERLYAAERTADEAPHLAMTKRLKTLGVNLEAVLTDDNAMAILQDNIRGLQEFADNQGVFVYDTANGGGMQQIDTALGDLDSLIMTQFQLCAAIAEVPASKLLEQSIGGLGSTGEYEQEGYYERLESIQTSDLAPLVERHHALIKQVQGIEAETEILWQALDSPSAKEFAEIDQMNANTVAAAVQAGVIGQDEGRKVLDNAKDGLFSGQLPAWEQDHSEVDSLLDEALAEIENNPEA